MRLIQLLITAAWLGLSPARADISAGLQAYDGGDYAQALAEWRTLAQAGDPDAQTALAGLFMDGLGVARDPAAAIYWYRRAAHQGAVMAQLNLGDLYARGLGVERDLVVAYAWLELAARTGQSWARRRRNEIGRRFTPAQIAAARALADSILTMQ
jgi:uncharacterized protein